MPGISIADWGGGKKGDRLGWKLAEPPTRAMSFPMPMGPTKERLEITWTLIRLWLIGQVGTRGAPSKFLAQMGLNLIGPLKKKRPPQ